LAHPEPVITPISASLVPSYRSADGLVLTDPARQFAHQYMGKLENYLFFKELQRGIRLAFLLWYPRWSW
jgi:hypothetical protein